MGLHSGRVAVVTGAVKGLGRAFAERLAEGGASVVVSDRNDASAVAADIEARGGRAVAITCDVTSPESVDLLARSVHERYGRCDILVNNAGRSQHVPFADLTFDQWRALMAVNVDSQFLTCRAFVPGMRARGWGRVVNVSSSTVGDAAQAGFVHYVASKMAVIGLSRALASDAGGDNVTVNALCPGLVRTPATEAMLRGTTVFDDLAHGQTIKRTGVPGDVAGAVSFLASDDAGWMTGQTVVVDGGVMRV